MASQAVTLIAFVSLGLAPERPPRNTPTPEGPQPEFVTVRKVLEAQKVVICLQTQTVTVPVAVTVFENGRPTTRTVYRQEYRMMERAVALGKDTITNAAGKKLSAAEALKRIKVGDVVLMANGPVDPLYLRIIRPETLIVVSPREPAAPVPVTPPPIFKDSPKKDK